MNLLAKIGLVIAIIILFLFVTYLSGKILVAVLNQRLKHISINIDPSTITHEESAEDTEPSPSIEVEEESLNLAENSIKSEMESNRPKMYEQEEDTIEGFDNADNGFKPLDPTVFVDKSSICCLDHEKCKTGRTVMCNYGPTNYAFPSDMSPIDKRIFMLNYSENFTLQDYVNWLKCFKDNKNELPYNHLKNLDKIDRGEKLRYKKGVLPPPVSVQPQLSSQEYFDKLYSRAGRIQIYPKESGILGYNYNEFPAFYQNFDEYGSVGRIYNVKDVRKKYSPKLVNNFVEPKLTRY